eukprot:1001738-Pelagomonas_calceolata.AAC.1
MQGLTAARDGTDVLMDLAIAWRQNQMLLAGERKPLSYVGSGAQAKDLRSSNERLMRAFHAVDVTGQEDDEGSDDENPAVHNKILQTVKLHRVIDHAPADILAHGLAKNYSAQMA